MGFPCGACAVVVLFGGCGCVCDVSSVFAADCVALAPPLTAAAAAGDDSVAPSDSMMVCLSARTQHSDCAHGCIDLRVAQPKTPLCIGGVEAPQGARGRLYARVRGCNVCIHMYRCAFVCVCGAHKPGALCEVHQYTLACE